MIQNRFKLIILTVFLICGIHTTSAQEKGTTLKIMSYNLRFGELASMQQFANFIKEENPDLVALQEVDVNTKREKVPYQNGVNFISELAYRTNMLSLYGKTIPHRGGYYGIGILTKHPYESSKMTLLPYPEGSKEQRGVLVSEIRLPNNQLVTFVSTHLDYTTSEVRQAQIEFINELLLKTENPVIICGDFNAKPNSKEIAHGMRMWLQVCTSDFTIPADNPKSKIDYIYCYPKDMWETVDAKTPNSKLSDHLPIMATVRLKEN